MADSGIDVQAGPSHDFQPVRDIHAQVAVLRAIEWRRPDAPPRTVQESQWIPRDER